MPHKNTNRPAGDGAARLISAVQEHAENSPNRQNSQAPIPRADGPMTKSWRDNLPVHPAADMFPMMPPDELRALGEDIKANGLRNPCVLVENDMGEVVLIDGRNRLDALELIGEKITLDNHIIFERFMVDDGDILARVISLNIHRRHLTAEQKRELIGKLLKATPDKSDRQIAETVKASPTTVGTVRAKLEEAGDVSKLDTRTDATGRQQPAAKPKLAKADDKYLSIHARLRNAKADSKELERKLAHLQRDYDERFSEICRLKEENAHLRSRIAELEAGVAPPGSRRAH